MSTNQHAKEISLADQPQTRCVNAIGASPSTVWRRVRDKSLPAPIRLHGLTRWSQAEVEAAIAAKLAERDTEAA